MSKTYSVTISDTQDKALSYAAVSQQDWIDNSIHARCDTAIDQIVKICVEECTKANVAFPPSKEAMVDLAFANGWVKTAYQQNEDAKAAFAAQAAAQ